MSLLARGEERAGSEGERKTASQEGEGSRGRPLGRRLGQEPRSFLPRGEELGPGNPYTGVGLIPEILRSSAPLW